MHGSTDYAVTMKKPYAGMVEIWKVDRAVKRASVTLLQGRRRK